MLYTQAGPEISVASTKAMCSQMAVLLLLALYWGRRRGRKGEAGLLAHLRALPALLDGELPSMRETAARIARACAGARSFFYLGRGPAYPLALEGALKLKELSYIHAEGYAAGEMKHGPIALIDPGFPVIAVATKSATYDKTVSNLMECKARGAKVIVVAAEGDEEINKIADCIIRVPAVRDVFSPITASVPLQLLAREVAILRGCDVDQPRNLAKSVTVE